MHMELIALLLLVWKLGLNSVLVIFPVIQEPLVP